MQKFFSLEKISSNAKDADESPILPSYIVQGYQHKPQTKQSWISSIPSNKHVQNSILDTTLSTTPTVVSTAPSTADHLSLAVATAIARAVDYPIDSPIGLLIVKCKNQPQNQQIPTLANFFPVSTSNDSKYQQMSFHQMIQDTKQHHHECKCTCRLTMLIQCSSILQDIGQTSSWSIYLQCFFRKISSSSSIFLTK